MIAAMSISYQIRNFPYWKWRSPLSSAAITISKRHGFESRWARNAWFVGRFWRSEAPFRLMIPTAVAIACCRGKPIFSLQGKLNQIFANFVQFGKNLAIGSATLVLDFNQSGDRKLLRQANFLSPSKSWQFFIWFNKIESNESKFSPRSRAKKLFKIIKLFKLFKLCRTSPILSWIRQSYSMFNWIKNYNMH